VVGKALAGQLKRHFGGDELDPSSSAVGHPFASYRATEQMYEKGPGSPARRRIGLLSGLWRVTKRVTKCPPYGHPERVTRIATTPCVIFRKGKSENAMRIWTVATGPGL
jgi:hypothetical protein